VDELVKYFFDGGNPGNEVMIESFRERVGRVRGMWWLVWWWRGSEGWRWLIVDDPRHDFVPSQSHRSFCTTYRNNGENTGYCHRKYSIVLC